MRMRTNSLRHFNMDFILAMAYTELLGLPLKKSLGKTKSQMLLLETYGIKHCRLEVLARELR